MQESPADGIHGRSNSQAVCVAVVGAGAFGRHHLRIYRELEREGFGVELAAVVDPNPAARDAAATEYGIAGFSSIEDCMRDARASLRRIDAASVCVPTVEHARTSHLLMDCGIDLLIEKPLAGSLAEADDIVKQARKLDRIVQPGHLERFNPAVRALHGLLTTPMFFEVHRLSVFTPRSLDVDVVLDLMIHDLDIVLKLAGVPVREVRAVGLPVLSNKVDIANVRLEFENGCVANLTASRVSTERVRKMRFFQPHQYLSLDFARRDLLLIDVTAAASLDHSQLATMSNPGAHPSGGMSLRRIPVESAEPLRLEIEAFLKAVRDHSEPVVTAEDGRAALALALEINAAMKSHAQRTGLIAR